MNQFKVGQRWISEMEPELGLGIVEEVAFRSVKISFPASESQRMFATATAPLKRVSFQVGDTVAGRDGSKIVIESISDDDGLFFYHSSDATLPESDIADTIGFSTPVERLLNGLIDPGYEFNLRWRTLQFGHQLRKSPVRGFTGGRIDLVPHQLYVAGEVASRHIPRVLLSDETGLGKTIEVCLILHRLLITERISRVLVLLPQSLVHQWFIEFLRRFNLVAQIMDEEYCESAVESAPRNNPFLQHQLIIASIDFMAHHHKWRTAAVGAGWDLLVVDEAHHLTENSAGLDAVRELGKVSSGLLLLTATPEQLGHRSHFLRLQLLDPARYYDFDQFEEEEQEYQFVADIIGRLLDDQEIEADDVAYLNSFAEGTLPVKNVGDLLKLDQVARLSLVMDLLDRYGTGRAVFRNMRSTMSGFPKRLVHMVPLSSTRLDQGTTEYEHDLDPSRKAPRYQFSKDPRVQWLVEFLKEDTSRKVLLICRTVEKAKAIDDALRGLIKTNMAVFHEELSLLQRDRNASWFAEADGAQILICSEIGSEGRNFQFAHNLVLFDLPLNPELLEQRIGRLDRIGQSEDINIYVPYIEASPQEVLARWHHEGLGILEKNVAGSYKIYRELSETVQSVAGKVDISGLGLLLETTQKRASEVSGRIASGRNRLLELNSYRKEKADRLLSAIEEAENSRDLEKFLMDVFHLYGIRNENKKGRTYRLDTSWLSTPEFPLPPLQGKKFTVTFDREIALKHEEIEFLTWDHPMVTGLIDLVVGSDRGNCSVVTLEGAPAPGLVLEAVFMLESVASPALYVDRFLAPTPIRVFVNQDGEMVTEMFELIQPKRFVDLQSYELLENTQIRQELLPEIIDKCHEIAMRQVDELVSGALGQMRDDIGIEINRLQRLRSVNPNIRKIELDQLDAEKTSLENAIASARLRLDALRVIFCQ